MTIEFTPEQTHVIDQAIGAGLIKSADEAADLAVDELRRRLGAAPEAPDAGNATDADQWMRKLRTWAYGHSTATPLLSDEAISRESIYRERGL